MLLGIVFCAVHFVGVVIGFFVGRSYGFHAFMEEELKTWMEDAEEDER